MIKKIGLLLLSLLVIFGFGVSFANPIAPTNLPDVCYKIKNVGIDNYKVIVEYGKRDTMNFGSENPFSDNSKWEVYEFKSGECTRCSRSPWRYSSKVYLVDKNVDIAYITEKNIDDIAIFIGEIGNSTCASYHNEILTYKITREGDTYKLEVNKIIEMKKIKEFPFFRLGSIIIESLLLFYIAKLFRKEEQISNKKLFLFGIIPTTITLPLLRFVLPLILGGGIWYIIIGELLVTVIETIIIKYGLRISWMKAIISSVICNLFSFLILSYESLFDQHKNSLYRRKFLTSQIIMAFLLYVFIRETTLPFIAKVLRKNDETSNKRLILTGFFAPIASVAVAVVFIQIMNNIFHWEIRPLFISIGIYLILELLIIEYGLKISRKKSIMVFMLPILCFFILYVCLNV